MQPLYRHTRLQPPDARLPSVPSWQPRRAIDHILVSDGVGVERRWALPDMSSDHLAVAAELTLPAVG